MDKETLNRLNKLFDKEDERNRKNPYRGTCRRDLESDTLTGFYRTRGYWTDQVRFACSFAYDKALKSNSTPLVIYTSREDKRRIPFSEIEVFDIRDQKKVEALLETTNPIEWDKIFVEVCLKNYEQKVSLKKE